MLHRQHHLLGGPHQRIDRLLMSGSADVDAVDGEDAVTDANLPCSGGQPLGHHLRDEDARLAAAKRVTGVV